jgi:hypothetical protein
LKKNSFLYCEIFDYLNAKKIIMTAEQERKSALNGLKSKIDAIESHSKKDNEFLIKHCENLRFEIDIHAET